MKHYAEQCAKILRATSEIEGLTDFDATFDKLVTAKKIPWQGGDGEFDSEAEKQQKAFNYGISCLIANTELLNGVTAEVIDAVSFEVEDDIDIPQTLVIGWQALIVLEEYKQEYDKNVERIRAIAGKTMSYTTPTKAGVKEPAIPKSLHDQIKVLSDKFSALKIQAMSLLGTILATA